MVERAPEIVISTPEEYRDALRRAGALREAGASATGNAELARLEAAIARYAARPGAPARRAGRPDNGSSDTM
ncbi:MAG: hypothetical protein RIC93_02595 [Alphaproteobacteria bacterium]